MKHVRISIVLLASALGLALAGCGGGSGSVPGDAVAVVDGTEIPRAELDTLVAQAKKSYEATKQEFPKVGTPEYQQVQQTYVAFLVRKTEYEQAAEELGIKVTDKDVDRARTEFVKSRFDGDEKKLADALEEQGLTEETFRETLFVSELSQKIFNAVTKDVAVSEADVLAAYTQNQDQYRTPESRVVRHILVSEKRANGQVDYPKSKTEADRIYGLLQNGGDFAALARQLSDDTGTKSEGGQYTVVKDAGTDPAFEKVALQLKTGAYSRPVKTAFGYHLIQASADVKPAKVTPLAQVRESPKATLLQDKKNEKMTEWVEELDKRYKGKVSYAAGLAPQEVPEATETTDTTGSQ
jgi:parvulin-like peptidyl-prolyl isomerase